jgi:hypothetical protein
MKANFKRLGLATAVAAASAGYAGVTSAQTAILPTNNLGDLAVIPYYTVLDTWGTGMHIINTSDLTQVVKLRFRRGSDSLDALDLNVILSPKDEWTAFLNDTGGTIKLTTQDTSCTAPIQPSDGWGMPDLYRDGADEGYIEVISMGAVDGYTIQVGAEGVITGIIDNSLAYNAEHVDAVPRDCVSAETNFLDGRVAPGNLGVKSNVLSSGRYINPSSQDIEIGDTDYIDGGNVLKVSWFIRDADTGIEFGDDAAMVADFETAVPFMTNQETGVFSGDLGGFDFPDLNGGSPAYNGNTTGAGLDKYNDLRTIFGVASVINDWSDNPDLSVGTDWVITIPGQYVMLDLPEYLLSDKFNPANDGVCLPAPSGTDGCDQRDIPVRAAFAIWDREETLLSAPGDRGVVVSPSIPGQVPTTELRFETNVIHWSDREVMASEYDISVDTSLLEQVSGWASLSVTSKGGFSGPTQGICSWNVPGFDPRPGAGDPNDLMNCAATAEGAAPMVGFVAWERSFPNNPDGNYGRAVRHSYTVSS